MNKFDKMYSQLNEKKQSGFIKSFSSISEGVYEFNWEYRYREDSAIDAKTINRNVNQLYATQKSDIKKIEGDWEAEIDADMKETITVINDRIYIFVTADAVLPEMPDATVAHYDKFINDFENYLKKMGFGGI